MEEFTLVAALFAASGPATAAIFVIGSRLRNNKKDNPGSLHDVHLALTRIEEKLSALTRIEEKLDRLGE